MKLSERIDAKITQLKDNTKLSRKVTAEIFGTAAELLELQESTIKNISLPIYPVHEKPWTVYTLKKEYATFKIAQLHFKELYGLSAKSWSTLVYRVNLIENTLIHLNLQNNSNQKIFKEKA